MWITTLAEFCMQSFWHFFMVVLVVSIVVWMPLAIIAGAIVNRKASKALIELAHQELHDYKCALGILFERGVATQGQITKYDWERITQLADKAKEELE